VSDEEGSRPERSTRTACGATRVSEEDGSPSSDGRTAMAPARGSRRQSSVVLFPMEGDLLRSPPILHASESSIGEWKALEMENAVV
jgi:hypothetical protein